MRTRTRLDTACRSRLKAPAVGLVRVVTGGNLRFLRAERGSVFSCWEFLHYGPGAEKGGRQ